MRLDYCQQRGNHVEHKLSTNCFFAMLLWGALYEKTVLKAPEATVFHITCPCVHV